MMRLQERTDAVHEADDIGIEALEVDPLSHSTLVAYPNHINCPDGSGFITQFIQEGNDCLLVGDGHVETSEAGMLCQHLRKLINGRKVEVEVFRIDSFAREPIIKERA